MSAKVIPSKIHLIGFRILHAEMNSPFEFEINEISTFENESIFDMTFNYDDNLVKADFKVNISTRSNENSNIEEANAKFHFVFLFNVENFKDLAQIVDEEKLELKGGLSNALTSIVYSTTRGILMTRFQGTALADFILPIIDPNELLKG